MAQISQRRVLPASRNRDEIPRTGADRQGLRARWLETEFQDGIWAGRRCFIVGGGPSLRDFEWDFLKGELTIGINKAVQTMDPTILFSMDERFWGWYLNRELDEITLARLDAYQGYKAYLKTGTRFLNQAEIYHVGLYEAERDGISPSLREGLGHGSNSGYAALNLAMVLGANPIYLLGFDMHGDSTGKQAWFHEGYPSVYEHDVYSHYRSRFQAAAPKIASLGYRVVNLNPDSALTCFEFGRVQGLPKPRRPVLVSFFTEEYNEHAYRLFRSARKFGFEYELHKVDRFARWEEGTQYKARFLREMLDRFPGRDLLWIDADGVIQQYPALFEDFEGDLGVHFRNGTELLSGTLYLRNNGKVKALLERWIARNTSDSRKWDQWGLQEALQGWNGTVVDLPASYTKIFDTMPGPAVIEHFQASRETRHIIGR